MQNIVTALLSFPFAFTFSSIFPEKIAITIAIINLVFNKICFKSNIATYSNTPIPNITIAKEYKRRLDRLYWWRQILRDKIIRINSYIMLTLVWILLIIQLTN